MDATRPSRHLIPSDCRLQVKNSPQGFPPAHSRAKPQSSRCNYARCKGAGCTENSGANLVGTEMRVSVSIRNWSRLGIQHGRSMRKTVKQPNGLCSGDTVGR